MNPDISDTRAKQIEGIELTSQLPVLSLSWFEDE